VDISQPQEIIATCSAGIMTPKARYVGFRIMIVDSPYHFCEPAKQEPPDVSCERSQVEFAYHPRSAPITIAI
jgi:hypothetical protein